MAKRTNLSAGLLMYRRGRQGMEVLLAHPGGPFWAKKDAGVWSLPKGEPDEGEDLLLAACREFEEETGVKPQGPYLALGCIVQRGSKTVHAWAWEGDADAAAMKSNTCLIEWPPRSGRQMEIPEVDRCEWFDLATARMKIYPAQAELIDRLEVGLKG